MNKFKVCIIKKQAIKKIKEIQSGSGINREKYPKEMIGWIASEYWNDSKFTLGIEYGYILGLLDIFKIKCKDLE